MEYEFGWNDPPTFSYSSSQAAEGKQTSLTKRPHHLPPSTLSQTNTPPTSGPPTSGPPTCGPPTSGPPTSGPPTSCAPSTGKLKQGSEKEDSCSYDQAKFTDVIERFNQLADSCQDKFQKRVYEDIKRRLNLLSQQASTEKISATVKLKTGRLLAAVEEGDYNKADHMQVGMMVDHVSEVSQWLVGIKKLIATLKD